MSAPIDEFLRLAVALLIGLLIGLDRERAEARKQVDLFAGIRTFPLIALAGAIPALRFESWGVVPLAASFLAVVGVTIVAYARTIRISGIGATTESAALVTFLLGALAGAGQLVLAASVGVAVALLLNAKPFLERFSRTLSQTELNAALELAVISGIVLPLLPNRGFGPWQVWNPFEIWLVVVSVSAVSFGGFVAMRLFGQRRGLLLSGLIGALVSSTAVTMSMARRSREFPEHSRLAAAATVLACAVMAWRMLFFAVAAGGALAREWLGVAIAVSVVGVCASGWLVFRSALGALAAGRALHNPFSLRQAIGFALFYALVLVAMPAARAWLGDSGTYVLAGISSLVDVDAVTIAFARATSAGGALAKAVTAVTIALIVNTLMKLVIAIHWGSASFGKLVGFSLAAMALAAAAVAYLSR
jgi:uncharacterized membrane protein (DUF4010 family)